MSEKKACRFIHVVICTKVFTESLKDDSHYFKILNPLPKDAQFIDLRYDDLTKTIHLFFTSEEGYELKEGEILSSIPVTDICFKIGAEND